MNELSVKRSRWNVDSEHVWGAILLLFLLLIAIALGDIAQTLRKQTQLMRAEQGEKTAPPVVSIAEVEQSVEAALTQALDQLLVKEKLSPAEAAPIAAAASRELLDLIRNDSTGQVAQTFADWIQQPQPAGNHGGASDQDAAVLPYLKRALENATPTDTVRPGAALKLRGLLAALTPDDIAEVRQGFFGAVGALPVDAGKALVAVLYEQFFRKPQEIKVSCTCCGSEKKANPPPPSDCPSRAPCPEPKAVTREFLVTFLRPGERRVERDEQKEQIDEAAAYIRSARNATVILWAHTDTTASDLHNELLAQDRGEAVYHELIKKVDKDPIRIAPLGEYALRVFTGDEASHPDNRVVVIQVRSCDAVSDAQQ